MSARLPRSGSLPEPERAPVAVGESTRQPAATEAPGLWEQVRTRGLGSMASAFPEFVRQAVEVLRIPPPDSTRLFQRVQMMERDLILPLKAAGILMLLHSFYLTPWIRDASSTFDVPFEYTRYFLWLYIGVNAVMAWMLLRMRRLPPALIEWSVFTNSLMDGIFLGALTLVTGGYNSVLYWLFVALIVRSAVSVPRGTSQLMLNLTLSTCYVLAGVIDVSIAKNLDKTLQNVLDLYAVDNPAEPLFIRLVLLLVMTFGCYAVQALLERQHRAAEEAREFAVREVQLRSAGRLAAEFAHQIKNPLAIINTAAFSLERALREKRTDTAEQVHMIQEEVERADRIITQVMGYAQLSEGHVEKLNLVDELDHAVDRVFPAAARYPIKVVKNYGPAFPPLLMQRRHASETFINVLQNAREALESTGGTVRVSARCHDNQSIEVAIADDGPGIPPDKMERVFEAYYTTKKKGTGLGLATVKHNVELYGGRVRLESVLGKGARFVLTFPARTLTNIQKRER